MKGNGGHMKTKRWDEVFVAYLNASGGQPLTPGSEGDPSGDSQLINFNSPLKLIIPYRANVENMVSS
jgi:hypothetical protein